MPDEVELSVHGEVATILIRRPTEGNALRGAMFDQLRKIGMKLTDAPPRFVLLAGEGPDFCVGLDRTPDDALYQSFEPVVRSRDAFRTQEIVTRLRTGFDLIARLPCPIVAAVEGRCAGAGFEFALVADLRVVAESAVFTLDDAGHGLVTGLGGLVRATAILGGARTLDRALTGRPITGLEARELGLASRLVPPGTALSASLELIQELRRSSPIARTQALLALRAIQGRLANELLEQETQAAARTWIASDWQTTLQAVRDKREPKW